MNHVLLGASLPLAVAVLLYVRAGWRASNRLLIAGPLAMGLFGAWAIVPDIPRALGLDGLYHRMRVEPLCDVFFFHYSIDKVESDSPLYAVGFVVVAVAVLYAAWRELALREAG